MAQISDDSWFLLNKQKNKIFRKRKKGFGWTRIDPMDMVVGHFSASKYEYDRVPNPTPQGRMGISDLL